MSAYMVSEDTLDLLASVAGWGREGLFVYFSEEILPPRSALNATREQGNYYKDADSTLIKEELRLENQASLRSRYSAEQEFDKGARFRPILQGQATIAQALGALRCYEYQACESNEWNKSYAKAICDSLRRSLCAMVSGDSWEYTRPASMAQRVRVI